MSDLDRLFAAWLAGPLDPADAERLCALLRDAGERLRWRRLADLEGALAERGAAAAAEPGRASPVSTRRLPLVPARRRARWLVPAAACLLVALASGWWLRPQEDPDLPRLAGRSTARGEAVAGPALLRWRDGTEAQLLAGGRIRVPTAGRGMDLDAGEVTVRAAHQPAGQPFTVRSAQAATRIMGTRFSLRCDATATSLLVDEGRVAFTPVGGPERIVPAGAAALGGTAQAPRANLVGWWPLDEASGTVAHDRSGQAHDGRIIGPQWTAGGLHFAGDDQRVDIHPDGVLAAVQDGDYSIAAWYRPDALPPRGDPGDPARSRDMFAVIIGRTGWTLGLHLDADGRFFMEHFLADRSPRFALSSPVAAPGRWYHLAGVVDRAHGETRVVVDGVVVGRAAWPAGSATTTYRRAQLWHIGSGDPGNPANRWPARGFIRDVRIYDRALDGHDLLRLAWKP